MPPKLIITRPKATAQRLADDVQRSLGRDVACVFSPAYRIAFLPMRHALGLNDALVFTSANGVKAAVRAGLKGRRAWCVGDKTALAAHAAGFDAKSASGDVDDLFQLILNDRPTVQLIHVAGEHTRGHLAQRLSAQGVACTAVIGYTQTLLPPTDDLVLAAKGSDPLVIPLFSPRAVFIIAGSRLKAPVHVVAMSHAIGEAATDLHADTVVIAKAPTYVDMLDQTCRVLTQLFDRTG